MGESERPLTFFFFFAFYSHSSSHFHFPSSSPSTGPIANTSATTISYVSLSFTPLTLVPSLVPVKKGCDDVRDLNAPRHVLAVS